MVDTSVPGWAGEGVMQVWLAAEVQLLSVSGFPSDIPIAANPLHRGVI
jgi:hypothetical protein